MSKCDVRSLQHEVLRGEIRRRRWLFASRLRGGGRRPAAFTLIELMLVASLVGVVVLSGATLLAQVGGARTRLAEQMDRAADADAALRAVSGALYNALRPVPNAQGAAGRPLFEVIASEVDGQPSDQLRFEMLDRRPVRPGHPEGDVREVDFSLESVDVNSAAGGPEGPFVLRRRLDPTRNVGEGAEALPGDQGGGVVDRLAGGLAGMEIACFDGVGWIRDWPATLGRYPVLVRVRLARVVDAETGRTQVVERMVGFPWMAPDTGAGAGPANTSQSNFAEPRP